VNLEAAQLVGLAPKCLDYADGRNRLLRNSHQLALFGAGRLGSRLHVVPEATEEEGK